MGEKEILEGIQNCKGFIGQDEALYKECLKMEKLGYAKLHLTDEGLFFSTLTTEGLKRLNVLLKSSNQLRPAGLIPLFRLAHCCPARFSL